MFVVLIKKNNHKFPAVVCIEIILMIDFNNKKTEKFIIDILRKITGKFNRGSVSIC